jgi:hypothetical protein
MDVDVTGNITATLCEVGSEFNIFCILVTMATATILIFFNSVQWFQRRRFKCEKLTDRRRTLSHEKISPGLWPGHSVWKLLAG